MACLLNIETSTSVCSVALTHEGQVLLNRVETEGPSHASCLGRFVQDALEKARLSGLALDAVAVSCGPGSYTGLRIGVSEAKGVCFGLDVPLIAVPTLEILACRALFRCDLPDDAWLCPMIDARRMEVFAAIYDRSLTPVKPVSADIVDAHTYDEYLDRRPIYFLGNGAEKCKAVLTHPHARFLDGLDPLAADMLALAERAFRSGKFEDTAYFEPFYLKEFVATTPKHKVI